jgi:hypothetical protein
MLDDTMIDDTVTDNNQTREDWLTAAVNALRMPFADESLAIPAAVRVACGFPSNARRSGAVGECWSSKASADKTVEILISPVLDNPREVLAVLVHELIHASGHMNHGAKFGAACRSVGLQPAAGSLKSTKPDGSFDSRYQNILADLGAYPHARLSLSGEIKKQGTRMLKASCGCGYTVRLTAKWAAVGMPTCPCGQTLVLANNE